jgi:hypothetical protein
MSDAIFWLPEAKTFPELHCKIPLKHFFRREHKHPLSTGTLRQVPEALAQKMAEGLDFQKLTTTCTVSLVNAPENICIAITAHGSKRRALQYATL